MAEPDHAPSSFEYRSRLKVFGLPLVHVVRGIDPPAAAARPPSASSPSARSPSASSRSARSRSARSAWARPRSGSAGASASSRSALMAAGQVAAGLLGAVGQLAVAPHALGMVTDTGPFVAVGWLMAGVLLALAARRQPAPPGRAAGHAGADRDRVRARRAGARRSRGDLGRSAACAAVQPPVRVLAHRPRRTGDARARAQRRKRRDRRRDRAGVHRLRQRGDLHPQRQLPRDRGTGLGAAHRDVARARRDAARRGTGHDDRRTRRRARPTAAASRPCSPGGGARP